METIKTSNKILPYININSEELRKAIKNIAEACEAVNKITPGRVSEKELSMNILYNFSLSGDVLYSKCDNGKSIATFIFKTFTKLAAVRVRAEITQDDLDELNKEYISTLEEFVKRVQPNENTSKPLYLSYANSKIAK